MNRRSIKQKIGNFDSLTQWIKIDDKYYILKFEWFQFNKKPSDQDQYFLITSQLLPDFVDPFRLSLTFEECGFYLTKSLLNDIKNNLNYAFKPIRMI